MSRKSDNEMAQIQRGLEDFLQRELQMYTLEEEQQEKELDIIGSTGNSYQSTEESYSTRIQSIGNQTNAGSGSRKSAAAGSSSRSRTSAGGRSGSGKRKQPDSYQFYEEDWDRKPGRSSGPTKSVKATGPKKKPFPDEDGQSRHRRKGSKERKRKSRLKRFLLAAILTVVLVLFGLYQFVGVVYNKLNYEEIESVSHLPMQEEGVVNILLIGNDSRMNGEDGRSDAMILLSISRKTKTIYMTSLLRDMYVDIPGRDGNRLNAAYSFGGPELLMKTVEQNLGVPVNRYMLVNFEAFANLVDAVGGVDLELTSQEVEYVNGYLVEYNILTNRPQGTDNMDTSVSGMVHLNGPQALAYCRNRYLGTDFGRTERQRKVLTEVIKKLPAAAVTNGGDLIDGLMPNLTTNLTRGECFRLSLMAGRLLTYDIVSDSIPQPGTYSDVTIRRMQVLKVDFDANRKYLREKIYGETEN